MKNNGPQPASGVAFDDTLPAGIQLGSTITIDNGTCTGDPASNSVHCGIGDLSVGQQSDISVTATATTAGSLADTGTVTGSNTDARPANNSFTVTVQP